MTGVQLKTLGGIPEQYLLFREVHGPGEDERNHNDTVVHLRDGDHFYDMSPGNFGCEAKVDLTTDLLARQLAELQPTPPRESDSTPPRDGQRLLVVPDVPDRMEPPDGDHPCARAGRVPPRRARLLLHPQRPSPRVRR